MTARGRVRHHYPEKSTSNKVGQHRRITIPALSDDDRPGLQGLRMNLEMMNLAPAPWLGRRMRPGRPLASAFAPVLGR
jgi:hypothetical protein